MNSTDVIKVALDDSTQTYSVDVLAEGQFYDDVVTSEDGETNLISAEFFDGVQVTLGTGA